MLTQKQLMWFYSKPLNVGDVVLPPLGGFRVHYRPDRSDCGEYVDLTLDQVMKCDSIQVKSITDGVCCCNTYVYPLDKDFYIREYELGRRSSFETDMLKLTCTIPFVIENIIVSIWNWITRRT